MEQFRALDLCSLTFRGSGPNVPLFTLVGFQVFHYESIISKRGISRVRDYGDSRGLINAILLPMYLVMERFRTNAYIKKGL